MWACLSGSTIPGVHFAPKERGYLELLCLLETSRSPGAKTVAIRAST